jgi:hypothetical protein
MFRRERTESGRSTATLIGEGYVGCCAAAALELVDQPILDMCQHVGKFAIVVDLKVRLHRLSFFSSLTVILMGRGIKYH